ncbi:MAG: NAD(P)/FAD-dependent oxidoreductase [Promethearchaeota archaeon]
MSDPKKEFDVIIVGGGPAGLSAGIVSALKGLKTAVFEGGSWGGLLSTIYPKKKVYNFPGVPSIQANHLVSEWVRQAADHGVYLLKERVTEIFSDRHIETDAGETYWSKAIIITTGMRPNELGIPGESKFSKRDRGVYSYVTDPEIFQNQQVLVVGGGDTAIDAILDLTKVANKIYLAHRRNRFRALEKNLELVRTDKKVEILTPYSIIEIFGNETVEGAVLANTKTDEETRLNVDKVILAVGLRPNTEIFEKLQLESRGKFLKTDDLMRTNVEGIFAAGDIVSPYQLAVVAASQGALAAHAAYLYIRDPYWKQEYLDDSTTLKRQVL